MVENCGTLWEEYSQTHNPELKNELMLKYFPMVKYVAGKMMISLPSCVEYDDLVSAGMWGLISALDRFDPTQGVKFETFVLPRIRGAILDELRTMDWAPRSLRSKARQVDKAVLDIERNLGRTATSYEIAKALEMDVNDYSSLVHEIHAASLLSLDGFLSDDPDLNGNMYNVIEDPVGDNPLFHIENEEVKHVLVEVIDNLPEQEKLVIALYYYEELTLREIGQVMQITESRVSQIHTKAINTLKSKLADEILN